MPYLSVNIPALSHNIAHIRQACLEIGAECLFVFKEAGLRSEFFLRLAQEASLTRLGVNTFSSEKTPPLPGMEIHHVYIPSAATLPLVSGYDVVYATTVHGVRQLARAAARYKTHPGVMLMIEAGDGREGLLPEELSTLALEVLQHPELSLRGLAVNFACLSQHPPTVEALALFAEQGKELEKRVGQSLELSVGGSDILELALLHPLPCAISEIRCGTAITLGVFPLSGLPVPGACHNTFCLYAEVVECRVKEGKKRVIFDFGHSHTAPEYITPPFPGMVFAGASSGYTIYDVSQCLEVIQEGMIFPFSMDFHSLSRSLAARGLRMRWEEDDAR